MGMLHQETIIRFNAVLRLFNVSNTINQLQKWKVEKQQKPNPITGNIHHSTADYENKLNNNWR